MRIIKSVQLSHGITAGSHSITFLVLAQHSDPTITTSPKILTSGCNGKLKLDEGASTVAFCQSEDNRAYLFIIKQPNLQFPTYCTQKSNCTSSIPYSNIFT